MIATTTKPAPSFLAAIAAIARRDDFSVEIEAEDAGLRVRISVDGHEPIEAFGAPAGLDAQLPAAIERYAKWVGEQHAKEVLIKIDLPRGMAPLAAAAQKPARPKRRAAAKKSSALKRKAAPKRRAAKRIARRTPPAKKPAAANQTGRAGKPECIADYKALKAKYGNKLTRRLFVDNAKTVRRYEKLWANNWPAFVKEAEGGKAAPASTPAAPAKTAASKPKKETAKPAPKTGKPKKDEKPGPWIVKAKGGKQLGATILEKKVGDAYSCSAGQFTVESVNPEKREILVVPKSAGIALPGASAPPAQAASAKKAVPYALKTEDGTNLGGIAQELSIGATWGPFERWEVLAVDHDKRVYTMKDRNPPAAAAPAGPAASEPKAAAAEKTS